MVFSFLFPLRYAGVSSVPINVWNSTLSYYNEYKWVSGAFFFESYEVCWSTASSWETAKVPCSPCSPQPPFLTCKSWFRVFYVPRKMLKFFIVICDVYHIFRAMMAASAACQCLRIDKACVYYVWFKRPKPKMGVGLLINFSSVSYSDNSVDASGCQAALKMVCQSLPGIVQLSRLPAAPPGHHLDPEQSQHSS